MIYVDQLMDFSFFSIGLINLASLIIVSNNSLKLLSSKTPRYNLSPCESNVEATY